MPTLLVRLICTFVLLAQVNPSFSQLLDTNTGIRLAQLNKSGGTGSVDLDPPLVDHLPIATGDAGVAQSFTVTAADTQGIASVTLFYRAASQDEYRRAQMRRVASTDNFIISLDTDSDQRLIEYYFLVVDTGDNTVLNGFPYDPFSRILVEPKIVSESIKNEQALSEQASTSSALASSEGVTKNRPSLLWGVLGVLAVGALISSSGGSGSPSDGATVPAVLTIPLPQ